MIDYDIALLIAARLCDFIISPDKMRTVFYSHGFHAAEPIVAFEESFCRTETEREMARRYRAELMKCLMFNTTYFYSSDRATAFQYQSKLIDELKSDRDLRNGGSLEIIKKSHEPNEVRIMECVLPSEAAKTAMRINNPKKFESLQFQALTASRDIFCREAEREDGPAVPITSEHQKNVVLSKLLDVQTPPGFTRSSSLNSSGGPVIEKKLTDQISIVWSEFSRFPKFEQLVVDYTIPVAGGHIFTAEPHSLMWAGRIPKKFTNRQISMAFGVQMLRLLGVSPYPYLRYSTEGQLARCVKADLAGLACVSTEIEAALTQYAVPRS
jgi:hypothetical protein